MATTSSATGSHLNTPVLVLVEAIQRLSLARSTQEVQEIVRGAARQIAGADGATFVLRRGESCYYADEDAVAPLWKGQTFPLRACISGWVMLNRKPAIIEDIYSDSRIPHDAYRATFVKSLAMVPMRTVDPIGAIGNYWADGHRPTEEEVELLQALADSTAVAMENVRVYEELEQRIRDRTRDLEHANRRLVELDEVRTRLAHTVTHELRTPLSVILGFASMLASRLEEPLADHAALIYESATRLAALTDDLSRIADVEQHDLPLDVQRVSLRDLVGGSVRAFERKAADAGIALHADLQAAIDVDGDPIRLAQLLDNLISNALKYCPAGSTVTIHARANGSVAELVVIDDGPGIDDADKPHVFDAFYRTAASRDVALGDGLGLDISNTVAAAHGGRLTVGDTPGGGATFTLTLPLRPLPLAGSASRPS